jgi:DNA mismatch repair protein MutL
MQPSRVISPIRLLPTQLADQIAAGEVIERPASVLKELLENSLDAASQRIDVELSRGGMESIRVSDDGQGICGSEMTLAISRHATSKIQRLEDLHRLQSLGFRGEALASICSVSQWELSSRRMGEDVGYSLRHDHGHNLLPVNHAVGTSVWIRKLFFNTPARRKFLRAERTEFRHCDEVFRRMALARFDVAFYLKHNARQVQRLPAVADDIGRSRRVSQLCGDAFVRNSLVIDFPHGDMRLWGWVSKPEYSRQQSDLQYFYINGRIIRDRVINHALRVAYQSLLTPGRHAAFVLHLEVNPAIVDVNVHPTKHEVRFRESRQIHDFLIRCLREALQGHSAVPTALIGLGIQEAPASYQQTPTAGRYNAISTVVKQSPGVTLFGQVQAVLLHRFVLTQASERLYLIDASRAQSLLRCRQWRQAYANAEIKQRPVLIPQRLSLTERQSRQYEQQQSRLIVLGFDVTQNAPGQLLLRAIPIWLHGFDSPRLLLSLLDHDSGESDIFCLIEQSLLSQQVDIATLEFETFLRTLAQQGDSLNACWREITASDLSTWLREQQPQHE